MSAISLWQPWASAIALGLKRIETRHWSTPYRGPIAIHAAKHWERAFTHDRMKDGIFTPGTNIPWGCIVATAVLADVWRTVDLLTDSKVSDLERVFGNYGPNRFAWLLKNIVALPEPIPFKVRQGFFNVPDELLGVAR